MSNSFFLGSSGVTELTDKDFSFQGGVWKLKSSVCTAVLFYAPWCQYCVRVKDEWKKFGRAMKREKGINVAALNCEVYQDIVRNMRNNMVAVQSFPTMIVFRKGVPERQIGTNESQRNATVLSDECIGLCRMS
jgi:thioredoxin-like negative regulator of GroEL